MASAAIRGGALLYRDLAGKIVGDLATGVLSSGARLPGERVLADRFGVSRGTVRRAIKVLEVMGLVEVRLGSGAQIVSIAAAAHSSCPNRVSTELAQTRVHFQVEVAALAATQAPEDALADLAALIADLADPLNGCAEIGEADRKFHLAIAQATQNAVIELCIHSLWPEPRTPPFALDLPRPVRGALAPAVLDGYKRVLGALEQRDPQAARAAMQRHLCARLPAGCACQAD